ncbi:MAG: carboxypeptidase-like regulatory domain-containing protein [Candidatus Cryptobacteroides sp.]
MKRLFGSKSLLVLPALVMFSGCSDNETGYVETGTVSGIVRDFLGNPVSDAMVVVGETGQTGVTDADGIYMIEDVAAGTGLTVTASSDYYPSKTKSISSVTFDRGLAYCDFCLDVVADLEGNVYYVPEQEGDAEPSSMPMEGAEVTYCGMTSRTDAAGHFLIKGVTIGESPVTVTGAGYPSREIIVKKDMFSVGQGVARIPDVVFTSGHLFKGLDMETIRNSVLWRYDEYRGGRNTKWTDVTSSSYMSCLDFYNAWNEDANAGTVLKKPDNGPVPADGDDFYSYMYGRKYITEDNRYLTLNLKAAGAKNEDGTIGMTFGVQVLDLGFEHSSLEYVGDKHRVCDNEKAYTDYVFDLGKYVGKEIAIAVGIYCIDEGEHAWKQMQIRKMTFSPKPGAGLGGGFASQLGSGDIEGLDGWHFSEEMRRSTECCDVLDLTGLPAPIAGDYAQTDGYHKLPANHIVRNWAVQYVGISPEPLVGSGFLMKCNSLVQTNFSVPQNYIYAKYAITPECRKMTVSVGAVYAAGGKQDPAYFRVTVLDAEGKVHHIVPDSMYSGAKTVENEFVQLPCSSKGDVSFDLSQFEGQEIVIFIGIYQGYESSTNGQHRFSVASVKFN